MKKQIYAKVKAYLNTATRNTFYNLTKEEQRYKNSIPYDELEKEASTENSYQELETTDFICSMMKTLSQREQDLLSLYYFVGLSIKETAQVMHLSVTNTKVTLHNTRKKLKKQFDMNDGIFYEKTFDDFLENLSQTIGEEQAKELDEKLKIHQEENLLPFLGNCLNYNASFHEKKKKLPIPVMAMLTFTHIFSSISIK